MYTDRTIETVVRDFAGPGGEEAEQDLLVSTCTAPLADWNEVIAQAPEARLQQSCEAAQIREQLEGCRSLFFSVRQGHEVVGQLFLSHGFIHPDLLQWCRPLLRASWLKKTLGVYRWFGGPLILDKAHYGAILRALLGAVDECAAKDRVFAIQDVAPPFYDPHMDSALVDEIYGEFGYAGRESATMVLNLEDDLESLWKNLNREARQKVNKGRKQDIRIVEVENQDQLLQYYQVRVETARRNGIRPPAWDAFLATDSIYMECGMARIFLAEHNGVIASGQMLGVFNGNIQLGRVSYSDYARQHNLHANDLMQWHIIEWGHAHKCRCVDWGGYTHEPRTDKEVGINRFKAKWGGTVLPYKVYNKVYGAKRQKYLDRAKAAARKIGLR